MKEMEQKLAGQYKKESDDILFGGIKFDEKLRQRVLRQVEAERTATTDAATAAAARPAANAQPQDAARESASPQGGTASVKRKGAIWRSKWSYGAAAAIVLLAVAVSAPQLRDSGVPGGSGISDGGASGGISTSLLTTDVLHTLEEAKERFGADLLAPSQVPAGFSLSQIEATGIGQQAKTRVVFFYKSGDLEFTYMADREDAVIPLEFFEPIEVNGTEGHVFAQPAMTELFWKQDGIQYAIAGSLTQEEAIAVAASLQ